jgi:nucleotide-binding universal stress UspA family protein
MILGRRVRILSRATQNKVGDISAHAEETISAMRTIHAMALEEAGYREYLTRIASACPPGTTVHAVSDMSVSRAIVDEATRVSAGALAMATHGRGGLKRMVLGSVADEVIRHSHTPVLVYRPS